MFSNCVPDRALNDERFLFTFFNGPKNTFRRGKESAPCDVTEGSNATLAQGRGKILVRCLLNKPTNLQF